VDVDDYPLRFKVSAGRPIASPMSIATRNWLCVSAALLLNGLFLFRTSPADPFLVFEAIGLTIPATLPAFAVQRWSNTPRVAHAWTLGLTLFATVARFSTGH
jgi:hypothetical protein